MQGIAAVDAKEAAFRAKRASAIRASTQASKQARRNEFNIKMQRLNTSFAESVGRFRDTTQCVPSADPRAIVIEGLRFTKEGKRYVRGCKVSSAGSLPSLPPLAGPHTTYS